MPTSSAPLYPLCPTMPTRAFIDYLFDLLNKYTTGGYQAFAQSVEFGPIIHGKREVDIDRRPAWRLASEVNEHNVSRRSSGQEERNAEPGGYTVVLPCGLSSSAPDSDPILIEMVMKWYAAVQHTAKIDPQG